MVCLFGWRIDGAGEKKGSKKKAYTNTDADTNTGRGTETYINTETETETETDTCMDSWSAMPGQSSAGIVQSSAGRAGKSSRAKAEHEG